MGNTVFPFEAVAPATPEERLLLRRYPLFFRAAYFPGTHPSNLGLWGIECGPGWHPLIEQAASIIEADLHKLLRRLTNVQMLTSVERRLQYIPVDKLLGDEGSEAQPEAVIPYCSGISKCQNGLRIQISAGYLEDGQTWLRIRTAANMAQSLAKSVCELCGAKGRSNLWNEYVYCCSCDPFEQPMRRPASDIKS